MKPRGHIERMLNRAGLTLLGRRDSHGVTHVPYRVRRIGTFPDAFVHLSTDLSQPFEVSLDRITTSAGFSYDPDGWHPYLATLREQLAEPGLPYERSILCRYYACFRPGSVQDIVAPTEDPISPLPSWPPRMELFMQPWSLTRRRVRRLLDQRPDEVGRPRRQELGPQTDEFGRAQLDRILATHASFRDTGFRPGDFRDGRLTGYFLVRDQRYRFVVTHGNHRLPALRVLGITEVPVRFHRAYPPVINEDELSRWTQGPDAVLTEAAARAVFSHLFDGTGADVAARLGLLPPGHTVGA